MIVESGSATMEIDLNLLNGITSTTEKVETLRFAVAPNSFFPILVFNSALRGAELGSMGLIAQSSVSLPAPLSGSLKQLVIEKIDWSGAFDIVVRDGKSGFVFFNIEGNLYGYNAGARLLSIHGGRLLISKEFADALGRPSQAGLVVGKISVAVAMQPIEIDQVLNSEPQSVVMPAVGTQPGPDVIVGDLSGLAQFAWFDTPQPGYHSGGCTILYNVGNHTLAELLDFPTMDDPPEVAAEKQRRLLEMTPAKNAPVSA